MMLKKQIVPNISKKANEEFCEESQFKNRLLKKSRIKGNPIKDNEP